MSSDTAIDVQGVHKVFRIYDRPADRLKQAVFRNRRFFREFPALTDVSFRVGRGHTVGIVGRNGSGKSTLLQILAGTLNPTAGSARVHGRVAALLELGAGFNPEFTGRENVFLNASILGLSRAETEARFDAIHAFSEIGDFMDQPVKTYSSGMYVRLAFAVAVNVDPEVLIVDEALSVGDEAFQRKCFARIEAFQERGGTILFVSHSNAAIVELCDEALLMDGGELLYRGEPKAVISRYQRLIYAPRERQPGIREEIRAEALAALAPPPAAATAGALSAPGTSAAPSLPAAEAVEEGFEPGLQPSSRVAYEPHGAVIAGARIETLDGRPVNLLVRGRRYRYAYDVAFERAAADVICGMTVKTISGVELGGCATAPASGPGRDVAAGERLTVGFEFSCDLLPGTYFLNCGLSGVPAGGSGERHSLHRILDAVMFRVQPESGLLPFGTVDLHVSPAITPQG